MRPHLTEFFEAVAKLKEIGLEINEEVLTILLLYSLPDSFENFRCAIETRDELPKPEILRVKILEEFQSRKSTESGAETSAMYVKNAKFRQNRRVSNEHREKPKDEKSETQGQIPKRPRCYRCDRVGHVARYCKARYPSNSQMSARQAEDDENEPEFSDNASGNLVMLNTVETAMYSRENVNGEVWCLDSGCTAHMCTEKDKFEKIENVNKTLNLANSESTSITGAGNVRLSVSNGKKDTKINFEKVYYVSDLRTNLISVSKITDRGYEVLFREKDAIVTSKNEAIIFRADRVGSLYYARKGNSAVDDVNKAAMLLSHKESETVERGKRDDSVSEANNATVPARGAKNNINEWHYRLGHLNERDLRSMAKSGVVHGLKLENKQQMSKCEVCTLEKQTRLPFPENKGNRTKNLLEIVHTDVCDPMRNASFSGAKYFVTFIDDKSRWCEIFFVKNKSDVLGAFKKYKAAAETLTGRKIKALQSDNGKEYCNKEFDQFLEQNGIARRLTAPHTPQQNGLAERKNRTLVEMARCMMSQANAPSTF